MVEVPDVLCINCEDMISIEKVEFHSAVCLKPTSQVVKMSKSNYHYQIQYKINKLKSAIEFFAYDNKEKLNEVQVSSISLIINSANQLVALIEPASESIDLCTEISCRLRKVSDEIAPKLLVYSERLRNLALDKTYYFLEYLQVHKDAGIVQSFITKKSRELTDMKNKIMDYNKKSLKLQKLLKKCESIDDIQSQVESIKTTNSNLTSPMMKNNIDAEIGDLDTMIEQQKQLANEKSMEDLKKYFYSKCLSVKLSYSSRHPAQYIQIPELYNKIVKSNTPLDKWEECIRDEFDHPERWVNLKVIPK